MTKRANIFLFLFLAAVCILSAQSKPRLAILPITGGTGGDGETIAELFSFEREIINVFTVIPRTSSIETIMREQQFQRSTGLTDSDTIARLGKQANADFVVAGHIHSLGNSRLVIITIIHVESLQQIAGAYREYRSIEEVQGMIPEMARLIAHASRVNRTNLPRLAVLPFAIPAGVNQSDAEVLAQLLATEVANSGRYAVLPRTSQIQTVMREHEIQRSGLTEENSIKVIGQALNSQFVLAGNVRRLGQANMFTAQILDVESASLLVGGVENYNTIGEGLTMMASLSLKITGTAAASVPTTSSQSVRTTAVPQVSVPTSGSNMFISNNAEWLTNFDPASTASFNIGSEQIDGQQRDVLTIDTRLATGNVNWAGIMCYNGNIINNLKNANGIRFKALGDGKSWAIQVPIPQTEADSAHFQSFFATRNGRVVNIDINFSKLRQPDWGRRASFNKNNIMGIHIQRDGMTSGGRGASTIKIFDFEIY